jgi:hypothetical protein
VIKWNFFGGCSSITNRSGCIFFSIFLCLLFQVVSASAQTETNVTDEPDRLWSVSAFGGVYTNRDFGSTISRWPDDTENDQMIALSVSRRIGQWGRHLTWEVEGLFAEHFGKSGSYRYNYEEMAAFIVLRYHTFPWNRYVRTSFAMGEGISYTTQVPYHEQYKAGDDGYHRFLNYLMAELTFGVPSVPSLNLVYRIHHRSGIYGLIGDQGSNYYCIGVRFSF